MTNEHPKYIAGYTRLRVTALKTEYVVVVIVSARVIRSPMASCVRSWFG
jgi:hypothetical protein